MSINVPRGESDETMTTIEAIESAIRQLPREDLAAFRVWVARFDSEACDREIEDDVSSGRLDNLAEEILADRRPDRE